MKEVLAQIASLILLDKAAQELGLNINNLVCDRVKELAATLPGKAPTGHFNITFSTTGRVQAVPVPTAHEMGICRSSKLEAIKQYKQRTGQSLMNSKYAIEQYNGL